MAHLTAIIDQITRMENSLVNILLETAVKLSTLTDANIFVMVESAGGRKWAGRKSLRDEYVRGMLKPSTKDVEVTETVSSMPQEEFSMGSLMGMASGGCDGRERVPSPDIPAQPSPIYGAGPAVFPMAQQQPLPPPPQQLPQHQQPQQQQPREMADAQPSAAKRPRISAAESSPSINLPSSLLPAAAATAAKVLNASNNNIASSPPHHRRKSPNRDTVPQPVIMDGGRASPIPPSTNNRQETISKNLKDEFNGDEHPPDDAIVIKEELGRIGTPRGGGGGGGVGGGGGGGGGGSRGIDDAFEDEDPEASVDGGSGSWGEVALAGPSGLQQDSDANQPVTSGSSLGIRVVAAASLRQRFPASSSSSTSTSAEFKCQICGESTNSKIDQELHELMHVKEIVKICSLCNKSFFDVDEFGLHMDRHFEADGAAERKYACGDCGARFTFKHHLDRHSCSEEEDAEDNERDFKPDVSD